MYDPKVYTEAFTREHGFTADEWRYSLTGAVRGHALSLGPGENEALVQIGAGQLHLHWTPLPPRAIALMRMPRLSVQYRFSALGADARAEFMRYFDLYIQRGGG